MNNQDMGTISQVFKTYTGATGAGNATGTGTGMGALGGFSIWGIFGGFMFGLVGFLAFTYGKKNSEWRPMVLGIAMMIYPYFVRGTLAVYLVGCGLCAALYWWRE